MRFPTRTTLAAGILAAGLAATGNAEAAPHVSHGVLVVRGSNGADKLALRLQAGHPNKLEIDFGDNGTANYRVNRNAIDRIRVNTLRGADQVRIDDANGAFTDTIPTTLDGGRGNDTLLGGRGNETLKGGPGNDTADGNQGNDAAILGAGDDRFVWDPGDGSDVVEGQDGRDRMLFNGANINESFEVAANGGRVRFTRNVGNITMDLDDVEQIDTNALGGSDNLQVGDLSGTDLTTVNDDLGAGDAAPDRAIVNATNGDDVVSVSGSAGSASVLGLAARVNVTHADATQDDVVVNALAGDDVVDGIGLAADAIGFEAHGNDGDDILLGGPGPDALFGGAGDDVLIGGPGLDVLDGGAGDNTVIQD